MRPIFNGIDDKVTKIQPVFAKTQSFFLKNRGKVTQSISYGLKQ